MKAEQGKKYAQILHGKVHWVFTCDDLPEWSDDAFECVDVTGQDVSEGMSYANGLFSQYTPETLDYRMQRLYEYPPIANYLDGVVKGDQAQIDKYIADCLAVKAKYPKP